MAWRWSKRQRL